ncbi:MAG: DUF6483 family protein [Lachnospiraceae bacterium]
MFEQDFVMRMIHEMVRSVLRLVFHVDGDNPFEETAEDTQAKNNLMRLNSLTDDGHIAQAEDELDDLADGENQQDLKIALLFYSHLNEQSDEFLEKNGFTRQEVKDGLGRIMERYGLGSMAETFLPKLPQ